MFRKIGLILLLVFLFSSLADAQSTGQSTSIMDVGFRQWQEWTPAERSFFVGGMMQMEEHLKTFAQYAGEEGIARWLGQLSTVNLSVSQLVDLISEFYRRDPENRRYNLSEVYSLLAIREQELLRQGAQPW